MSTLGDKVLDIPLPKIGEKSLFTKELETALATGYVDFVVHSLKDLPTTLPEGMAIGAVLEREDPRDALVVRKDLQYNSLGDLPPDSIIGTSSLRRTAQLARCFPQLKVESIRGNLNTRMRKLDDLDKFSAIVLAQAGLCRMGWQNRISKILKCNEMMYAVGQGALAVECRENDLETLKFLEPLHCPETLLRILAERSFLKTLGGGCSAPVAVTTKLVPFEDKLSLQLSGGVWSLDGTVELKDNEKCTVEVKNSALNLPKKQDDDQDNDVSSTDQVECPIPAKKKKIEDNEVTSNILREEDPHKHCPVALPVGLDFMGKCPYLESHPTGSANIIEKGKCPFNAEVLPVTGEASTSNLTEKITKCPYMKDGKLITLDDKISGDHSNNTKTESNVPLVCPYREPKLYCGLVPSKRTPLWSLEQAEHLGINLAEKLMKNGALDVMKAAQAQIRASI